VSLWFNSFFIRETALMMLRNLTAVALLLLLAFAARAADYSAKVADSAAPKELDESIRKLLNDKCVQLLDAKGGLVAEVWLRKELPAKATEAQIKNGLTYRELPQTTVMAALRVVKPMTDYRKQKIKEGVYTLRLAIQPQDGDHMGTALYSEFCLACPAADDKKPDTMEPKDLHELSKKSTAGHPCVFLLFPGKDAGDAPKVMDKGEGHWVLFFKQDVNADGKKATIGVGLTLIGTSPSA
jgi:hypothetical protein